jgi:hypothetical protein
MIVRSFLTHKKGLRFFKLFAAVSLKEYIFLTFLPRFFPFWSSERDEYLELEMLRMIDSQLLDIHHP